MGRPMPRSLDGIRVEKQEAVKRKAQAVIYSREWRYWENRWYRLDRRERQLRSA